MNFNEYVYERPNIDQIKIDFTGLVDNFKKATSIDEQNQIMEQINDIRNTVETMQDLVYIRHTMDTTDKYYDKENEYIDEITPVYDGLVTEYYKALINSEFKDQLKEKWGEQLFNIAELSIKIFSNEIVEDLQHENRLSSKYRKLKASAKIMFEGEECNLSQMRPFLQHKNREKRKKALEKKADFYESNEEKFDEIYDALVNVRHKIAKKLGYDNFIQLGYDRMLRSDYDAEMVATYRQQVLDHIVPLATKLRKRQQDRLGYKELKFYDESYEFLTGNATPQGNPEWIISNGKSMYSELSNETHEFFNFMTDKKLLDLVTKKGKAGGGYCTYIANYKSPFIFSNFNGTSDDIDVLTHEAGHAFQVYSSRGYQLPEYIWPTFEACEIHSMSMEFFTWPWMKLFFNDQVDKYKFSHLTGALLFIPYGVLVDHFQHWVYENPSVTPKERKTKWKEFEKMYLPHRDYGSIDFYNRGGRWFKQGHIFEMPFYYIDYTLAQVCAFQYWVKAQTNWEDAWESYLRLCKLGGSQSFVELINSAGLDNPFDVGTIESVLEPIKKWIDTVDDNKL